MANLADISYQKIEDSIMKVLISNEGSYFVNNKLYSQVLNVLDLNTTFVDRSFKFKFMLVLKSLESKYDDVVYDTKKETVIYGKQTVSNPIIETSPVNYTLPTPLELAAYIIDNNLLEHKQKTINHELVSGNYCSHIQKLVDNDEINYLLKDNEHQSVISRINSINMSNIFLEKLYKKIALLEEKNIDLENKLDLLKEESSLNLNLLKIEMKSDLEKLKDQNIDYNIRIEMLEKDYLQLYKLFNNNIKSFCINRILNFVAYTYIIEIILGIFIYKGFRYFIF